MVLVDEREPFDTAAWPEGQEVAVLTQTTLSVRDTERAITKIREQFPGALVRNRHLLCHHKPSRSCD